MKKVLLILIFILLIPITTNAETLRDYKNLLNKYKSEYEKNQSQIKKTENAINSSKNEIEKIKHEIIDMAKEIQQKQDEIVDYNNKIKEKVLESKQLFEYVQMTKGSKAYLDYAFGAETIPDFIYRISVVEQLVSNNEETIKELEKMVNDNKNRTIYLNQREKDMDSKRNSLTNRLTGLTGVKASLNENSVSVAQQVKVYQELVNSYVAQGCKDNDVIGINCAVTNNAVGWHRPIDKGHVTSEFGYRWGSLHRAIDVSNSNPYSTKIYPVANGTITGKYYDVYGALTIIITHRTASGKYYSSLYTHLSKYAPNVYVGKKVTHNDYIGYMGATGNAFGAHLHLEVAPCRILNPADHNCGHWSNYVNYMRNLYNSKKFKGPRDLIYFPKQGVSFNGRG